MLNGIGAPLGEALFWLGVSLALAHELDAVRAREWRLLFVLRTMPEERARDAFVLVHVPLVAALLWLATHPLAELRIASQAAFDVFLVVHAGLHRRLAYHALYDFRSAVSRALILAMAAVGALHLLIVLSLR